jgi:hypothetical protein
VSSSSCPSHPPSASFLLPSSLSSFFSSFFSPPLFPFPRSRVARAVDGAGTGTLSCGKFSLILLLLLTTLHFARLASFSSSFFLFLLPSMDGSLRVSWGVERAVGRGAFLRVWKAARVGRHGRVGKCASFFSFYFYLSSSCLRVSGSGGRRACLGGVALRVWRAAWVSFARGRGGAGLFCA